MWFKISHSHSGICPTFAQPMAIEKTLLSLEQINGFPALLKAYNSGSAQLRPLYGPEPSLEGFWDYLSPATYKDLDRELLAAALIRQYEDAGVKAGAACAGNIEKIRQTNTFTVCTGHQLCLLTGPLYFVYKIISAINLARDLKKKYPEFDFVPVYWMATEDHDFEEINHLQVFGKTYTWPKLQALGDEDASVPCGKINTNTLKPLLEALQQVFGTGTAAEKMSALVNEAYLLHANLADATRHFVNAIFGDQGLLIVDGNDKVLKAAFSKVMEEELLTSPNEALVQRGMEALAKLGFSAQVNPRNINLFYMKDDLRARIEKKAGSDLFQVLGTSITFTAESIRRELHEFPERFSPNVVLRPLYQQIILPNLAYVGGPGELGYWLEFKKMFDYHKVIFPILLPRNFALWIDPAAASRMDKLALQLTELSGPLPELEKMYINKQMGAEFRLDSELRELEKLYQAIAAKAMQADPTLKAAAEAELQKALSGLKNLEGKMTRAEKLRHDTSLNQLRGLKEKLFPGGGLQERVDNFIPLYLKHGDAFIDLLQKSFDPFEKKLYVFTEKQD
jgi:bacillithiol biosynthesis cysteine-adding enzyme BshC